MANNSSYFCYIFCCAKRLFIRLYLFTGLFLLALVLFCFCFPFSCCCFFSGVFLFSNRKKQENVFIVFYLLSFFFTIRYPFLLIHKKTAKQFSFKQFRQRNFAAALSRGMCSTNVLCSIFLEKLANITNLLQTINPLNVREKYMCASGYAKLTKRNTANNVMNREKKAKPLQFKHPEVVK